MNLFSGSNHDNPFVGRLACHFNTVLQLLYPLLMAISIGCILGLDNLLGLGDPAESLPGIPYP
jgi:hypothetical protein